MGEPRDGGAWDAVYRDIIARGRDEAGERREAAWLEPVLEACGPDGVAGSPRRVLDLGCGLGGDLAYLAERGWQGHGLEAEPRAVAEAWRRLAPLGIVPRRGDLRDPLPFGDGAFALVISKLALHALHLEEALALVREVRRVLAAGGVFAFMVNSVAHHELELQYDYRGAVEVEPGTWHLPSLGRTYRFYTPALARDVLGGGWRVIELVEGPYLHWGLPKRVVRCVVRRLDDPAGA